MKLYSSAKNDINRGVRVISVLQALHYVWAALRRDFRAFSFALIGCGISATVAIYQFAVFTSFLAAATLVPRLIQGDVWVGAFGVDCFDLASPVPEDIAGELLRFFPGATYRRVYVSFAPYLSPSGERSLVTLVGIDGLGMPTTSFTADKHDEIHLGVSATQTNVEIAGLTRVYEPSNFHLASFLGTPYTLMNGSDAADALRLAPDHVSYIVFNMPPTSRDDLGLAIEAARGQNPHLMIRSGHAFVVSTGMYWLTRTGGGAAILMACILATLLMVIFLINGIARFVQRRHTDLMSLLGLGSEPQEITLLLSGIALIFSCGGVGIALIAVPLLRRTTDAMVPWVSIGIPDYLFACGMVIICASAGAFSSVMAVRKLPLVEIFRT